MYKDFFLLAPSLFFACSDKADTEKLVVLHDKTILRDAPGAKSREIAQLKAAEIATDLGEVSRYTSKIKIGNKQQEKPFASSSYMPLLDKK